MTRRAASFLTALLLLSLLCGCATKPPASKAQEEPAEAIAADAGSLNAELSEPPAETAAQEQPEAELPEPGSSQPAPSEPMTWDERLQALLYADTESVVLPEQPLPLDETSACALAQAEAQRPRYQYQGWASVFSSPLAQLYALESGALFPLSHLLEPLWLTDAGTAVFDLQDGGYYAKAPVSVWAVRLFDENDPLTSLYICLDAGTGLVLGAGTLSD